MNSAKTEQPLGVADSPATSARSARSLRSAHVHRKPHLEGHPRDGPRNRDEGPPLRQPEVPAAPALALGSPDAQPQALPARQCPGLQEVSSKQAFLFYEEC